MSSAKAKAPGSSKPAETTVKDRAKSVRQLPEVRLGAGATLLRIGISACMITLFALSVRYALISRQDHGIRDYHLPSESAAPAVTPESSQIRKALKDCPLPIHPGAKGIDAVSMQYNGGDFSRVQYEVSAPVSRVFAFYRKWLQRNGWHDWVADSFHGNAAGQMEQLQGDWQNNETILRFYDQLQNTQLNFAKGKDRVVVYAEPNKDRPYGSRVAVQFIEGGAAVGRMPQMNARVASGRYRPTFQFKEQLGNDLMDTQIIRKRRSANSLRASLVAKLKGKGWETSPGFPEAMTQALPAGGVQMVRDREMLFLQVSEDETSGEAVAVMTTMSRVTRR